jgi:hypothetical protein
MITVDKIVDALKKNMVGKTFGIESILSQYYIQITDIRYQQFDIEIYLYYEYLLVSSDGTPVGENIFEVYPILSRYYSSLDAMRYDVSGKTSFYLYKHLFKYFPLSKESEYYFLLRGSMKNIF